MAPRAPSGGYLTARTAASASARLATSGTMMPPAPISRYSRTTAGSFRGTRISGVIPVSPGAPASPRAGSAEGPEPGELPGGRAAEVDPGQLGCRRLVVVELPAGVAQLEAGIAVPAVLPVDEAQAPAVVDHVLRHEVVVARDGGEASRGEGRLDPGEGGPAVAVGGAKADAGAGRCPEGRPEHAGQGEVTV